MNLAVLERMVREGDLSVDALRYLLGCRAECEWLDYKQSLDLTNDKGLCDFVSLDFHTRNAANARRS